MLAFSLFSLTCFWWMHFNLRQITQFYSNSTIVKTFLKNWKDLKTSPQNWNCLSCLEFRRVNCCSLTSLLSSLSLTKVRRWENFLTTSAGTLGNLVSKMFENLFTTFDAWLTLPPWNFTNSISKRCTVWRKLLDGFIRPPLDKAVIQRELSSGKTGASHVFTPSSGYWCLNLKAR